MRRTRNQIAARDFDFRLYGLLKEARAGATEQAGAAEGTAWRMIADLLSNARLYAERMMSKEDQENTDWMM